MNIWIFNHYAQGPEIPGGTRHYDLAKALLKKGHNVTIFAAGFHYTLMQETVDYQGKDFLIDEKDGVRFVWVKTYPYQVNNWKRMLNILSYAWRLNFLIPRLDLEKPDLIIGSTVHPFAPLIAARFARKYKRPFVFEIRDLWPQTFIDMGLWRKESLIARFFKMIEGLSIKYAKAVIMLSPMTEKYLDREYGYKDTVYIPNSVDLDTFVQRLSSDYKGGVKTIDQVMHLKGQGKFIVIYTGAIVQTNNINIILEAAQKISDTSIQIVLIGEGQEKKKFQEIAQEKQLENVAFYEPVQKRDLPYLLGLSDILLLVQGKVNWGSSNKLYDYLASKKPILTSLEANHNNIVEEIGCGFSCMGAADMAQKIVMLKKLDKSERDEKGEKAFAYVEKNHDIKQMASMLESLSYKLTKVKDA
jgi:glycosyltransferase involved in cell wall biosynthesis